MIDSIVKRMGVEELPKVSEEEEYQKSEVELQSGVSISEETISKIQSCMKPILRGCHQGGGTCSYQGERIKFFNCHPDHRVFSLEAIPEYVFKLDVIHDDPNDDQSIQARYRKIVEAQTVCRTHQLGLLVIPNAKLINVEANGKNYKVIAEKKLDFDPVPDDSRLYDEYASGLDETLRQLAVLVCHTGYWDVNWRNNPKLGQGKIGLVDLEVMSGADKMLGAEAGIFGYSAVGVWRLGSPEQGKMVVEEAKKHGVWRRRGF